MSNQIISLNVGGKPFFSRRSTLEKSEFFNSLINDKIMNNKHNDDIFVDLDPNLFIHILNKLRYPSYDFPEKLSINLWILWDMCGDGSTKPLYTYRKTSYNIISDVDVCIHNAKCMIESLDIISISKLSSIHIKLKTKSILFDTNNPFILFDEIKTEEKYNYKLKAKYMHVLNDYENININIVETDRTNDMCKVIVTKKIYS